MNRKRFYMACALALSAAAAPAAEKVRVVGQRVNLRARADLNAEVVGQVADGDMLEVLSLHDAWVEVVPPDSVDFWVHKDFVQGNQVMAAKLQVRAGPGINYSVVGNLQRGASVSPRGEFTEWLKIAPPPGTSLWISRTYVESVLPEKPKPPPETPVTVAERKETAPVRPSAAPKPPEPEKAKPPPRALPPAVAPAVSRQVLVQPPQELEFKPPPPGLALIPLDGQGRAVQREGVLKYTGHLLNRPSRFRLAKEVAGPSGLAREPMDTLCYVYGNEAQLRGFLGRRLLIRGREYWVRGARYPVVVPEQIIPRAAP